MALRVRLGWSQEQAAQELGVAQPSVAQWEKAKKPIPHRHLEGIAARAGESFAYFLSDAPAPDDRAEKLIAARWMEETAKRLRAEAMLPVGAAAEAERAGETTEVVREAEKKAPTRRPRGASPRKRRNP